jgi:mono/diheme cytochrome c family protein
MPLIAKESNDFISIGEYGAMLYNDPRGVSCKSCHGKKGEQKEIYTYTRNDKNITIVAPNIQNVTIEQLQNAIKRRRGIMPRYTLTQKELEAIVNYLDQTPPSDTNSSR